ncbi:bL21 family ribosomal protein [Candidatus Carsonella ruddii]|uniref:BL21 family ribosomal protein n=2 Tax=cellular organisms TaxID=131567 RepID=A0AAJ6FCC0_CARRU|nr:bL21 family ribosomal protein [Candidatus Carsonella ruddii]WGS66623.1 bL21 family ribosomal protein [Candidatus Carsonella ruddii]WGS66820.1 bL21 family ribosomal protein [Candidatus Carsonella ruddii]WGS67012.1 bL21 family ribosomal protein [Candidatus Carsonella ruddii]WGS67204.1 bL21 family ribosomal protein [Candidatus Carsonella ruddii]WMC18220.1 MAG: bL21 family ribosomal protein [Candidatus Carsonella ruddii]
MKNFLIFNINKKMYFAKLNNYLITDHINYDEGSKLIIKKIIFFEDKKIFFDKQGLNYSVLIIILKHFYIKSFSIKKKKRKNVLNKNINYKKKSLLYIQNII